MGLFVKLNLKILQNPLIKLNSKYTPNKRQSEKLKKK
jgi:hypothetical protein